MFRSPYFSIYREHFIWPYYFFGNINFFFQPAMLVKKIMAIINIINPLFVPQFMSTGRL